VRLNSPRIVNSLLTIVDDPADIAAGGRFVAGNALKSRGNRPVNLGTAFAWRQAGKNARAESREP